MRPKFDLTFTVILSLLPGGAYVLAASNHDAVAVRKEIGPGQCTDVGNGLQFCVAHIRNADLCNGTPFDGVSFKQRIEACTALIESGKLSRDELAGAYRLRAFGYYALDQIQRALTDLDQALMIMPKDIGAFALRGIVYQSLGKYALAIEDYDHVIELKPDETSTLQNRGKAYYKVGNFAKAIQDYDKVIALDPNVDVYYERGLAHDSLKQYTRAIQDYDDAIKLRSGFAEAFEARGLAYFSLQRYTHAIQNYDKAIELKPDYTDAYFARATAKVISGDLPGANKDFAKAQSLDSKTKLKVQMNAQDRSTASQVTPSGPTNSPDATSSKRTMENQSTTAVPMPGNGSLVGITGQTPNQHIGWYFDSVKGYRAGVARKLPIVMVFEADWCSWCRKLVEESMTCTNVNRLAGHAVFVLADMQHDANAPKLADSLRISDLPVISILEPDPTRLKEDGRINGYFPCDKIAGFLQDAIQRVDSSLHSSTLQLAPNAK